MRTRRERIEPPDVNALTPPVATWIQSRHPTFKTHANRGQAKSALTTGCFENDYSNNGNRTVVAYCNGFLYEFEPGKGWVLTHVIAPGDEKEVHPLWNTYVIQELQELTDPSRSRKKKS